ITWRETPNRPATSATHSPRSSHNRAWARLNVVASDVCFDNRSKDLRSRHSSLIRFMHASFPFGSSLNLDHFVKELFMTYLVIYGLVLGWLLLQRRPRRHVLALALPLAIVVLATCAYDRLTIGAFTVTPFGVVNLLGAGATYIEEDPGAPADVNAAVREIRDSMTPEDRA